MASYKKGQPANRSKAVKKRSYASRTPQARSYKMPGKVQESGSTAFSAIRLMKEAARNARGGVKTSKGRPAKRKTVTGWHGEEIVRTRAATRRQGQLNRSIQKGRKSFKREGVRVRATGSPYIAKAPVKPSKARRGPSNPKRRKR